MRNLTPEEMSELAIAGVTSEELAKQWDLFPDQDFVTAVGSVVGLKEGEGQARNKPFETQAQADADISREVEATANAEVGAKVVEEGLTGSTETAT